MSLLVSSECQLLHMFIFHLCQPVATLVTLSTVVLPAMVGVGLTPNCHLKSTLTRIVNGSVMSLVAQVNVSQLVATRVTLSTTDLPAGVGVQHLWVCDSSSGSCHVSIMSLHTNEPCVVESFHLADVIVTASETVPGCSTLSGDKFAFISDTVWLATEDERWHTVNML